MADPTPEEVHAALAVLAAAEAAREAAAAHVEPPQVVETVSTPAQATAAAAPVESAPVAPTPAVAAAIDSYLARSVKSSPNGF